MSETGPVEIPEGVDPVVPMEFDPSTGQPLVGESETTIDEDPPAADEIRLPKEVVPLFPPSWDDDHGLYPKRWP